jgi:YHS domain-containing protein
MLAIISPVILVGFAGLTFGQQKTSAGSEMKMNPNMRMKMEMSSDTAQNAAQKIPASSLKPQYSCPVTGDSIDKKLFYDYKGKRIYVCCAGCKADVTKDPEKYIRKLAEMGEAVEVIGSK